MEVFKETACATLAEFLDVLHQDRRSGISLFRGVKDAGFELIPSGYRSQGVEALQKLTSMPAIQNPSDADFDGNFTPLLMAFDELIKKFFSISNRRNLIGLPLSQREFEILDSRTTKTPKLDFEPNPPFRDRQNFPTRSSLPLFALMQHEELPTPLLDWSETPLTACFFAADGEPEAPEASLAVYTLNQHFLQAIPQLDVSNRDTDAAVPRLIYPSYAGNQNLHRQLGALTFASLSQSGYKAKNDRKSLIDFRHCVEIYWNNFIKNTAAERQITGLTPPFASVIHKVILPRREVAQLRSHLFGVGVTHSVMYPGFDGVRRELEAGWRLT